MVCKGWNGYDDLLGCEKIDIMKTTIIQLLTVLAFIFISAHFANAQTLPNAQVGGGSNPAVPAGGVGGGSNPPSQQRVIPTLQNPIKANSVEEVLYIIVDLAVFLGVIIAVLMFVYIGFKFIMAQGDSGALKDARQWFLYAVIGTAILISAKVIVEIIKNTAISAGVVNESLFKK